MTQVIAAPSGADQLSSSPSSSWLPAAVIAALAVVAAVFILQRRRWSLHAAPLRPSIVPPEVGFALVAAMFILGPVGAAVARRVWAIEVPADAETLGVDARTQLAIGLYAGQALVALAWWSFARRTSAPRPEGRPSRAGAVMIGLVVLVLAWPIVSTGGLLASLVEQAVTGVSPDALAHETLRALLDRGLDRWSIALGAIVVVVTPMLEELLYRGLLQESLRRLGLGPWFAITVTSVLFALMHWTAAPPHAVFALFLLSLAFGWAYERTGRLAGPVAMHVAFNGMNLGIAALLA